MNKNVVKGMGINLVHEKRERASLHSLFALPDSIRL